MWTRLTERLHQIGGREDPRRGRGGGPTWVAASVHSLVIRGGEPRHGGERLRGREHAFGELRMGAHLVPFPGVERAGLVPNRVRDAHPSDVMQPTRELHRFDLAPATYSHSRLKQRGQPLAAR